MRGKVFAGIGTGDSFSTEVRAGDPHVTTMTSKALARRARDVSCPDP